MQRKKKVNVVGVILSFVLCFFILIFFLIISQDSEEETSAEEQQIVYTIGDTQEFNGLQVTLKDISYSQYMGGFDGLLEAENGLTYCNITVDAYNGSSNSLDLNDFVFKVVYDGEYNYNTSWSSYSDFLEEAERIVPLSTLSNKILSFEVPIEITETARPLELTLSANSIFDDSSVVWKLR